MITRRTIVLAAAAFSLLPTFAQQSAPTILSVRHIRVKPDRIGDFQAAVKEYNGLLRKGNWSRRTTLYVSATGPSEYVQVRTYKSYAEMDKTPAMELKELAPDLARLTTRIQSCTESSETQWMEMVPGLSLPPAQPSKFVRTIRTRVRTDKTAEYIALMKSDLMPAVQKAGLHNFSLSRVRYGAPRTEFLRAAGFDSRAELDGTPAIPKAMGEDGYRKFNEKLQAITLSSAHNIYRYLPELSYSPPAQSSASGN